MHIRVSTLNFQSLEIQVDKAFNISSVYQVYKRRQVSLTKQGIHCALSLHIRHSERCTTGITERLGQISGIGLVPRIEIKFFA